MRKKLSVLALVMTVVLTGCSTSVPDLSKVDNDIAAQYMADALLQYDTNYEDSLVYDHSVLTPTPTPEPTVAPVEATPAPSDNSSAGTNQTAANGTSSGTGVSADGQNGTSDAQNQLTSVSLSDMYGVSGIEMKGTSYSVKSSYGSAYEDYTPKKGNKLIVVHFTISNTSGSSQKVDLQKQNVQSALILNGENIGKPLTTFAEGDLQFFKSTIASGKKKQGVLLFEVKKSVKVSDVKVQFLKGNSEATISVN